MTGAGQYLELAVLRIRTQEALAVDFVQVVVLVSARVHLGLVVKLGAVHAVGWEESTRVERFQMMRTIPESEFSLVIDAIAKSVSVV